MRPPIKFEKSNHEKSWLATGEFRLVICKRSQIAVPKVGQRLESRTDMNQNSPITLLGWAVWGKTTSLSLQPYVMKSPQEMNEHKSKLWNLRNQNSQTCEWLTRNPAINYPVFLKKKLTRISHLFFEHLISFYFRVCTFAWTFNNQWRIWNHNAPPKWVLTIQDIWKNERAV